MFKHAKKLSALALSMALALSLAACSTPAEQNQGGNGDDNGSTAAQTIIFGLSKTWETLKTTEFINGATHQVGSQIFDKLIYLDESNTVHPRGADSWEWSEDGMTLTFHLNQNATWHDGEKVTAEDYVFSYKFYATNEVQFQNRAGTKYLAGVDPSTGIETGTDTAEVVAVDEYTLELHMNAPYNQTSYMASALNSFYVLPEHCFLKDDGTLMSDQEIYDNAEYWNASIGSGPCSYVSEVADSSITLQADPDYHLGAPAFGTLIMQVIDTSTAVDKILSGDVDILGFNLSTEVAEQYLDNDKVIISKETDPSTQVNLCFNNKRVPTKIRQAVDRGINKQDILDKIYSGNGVVNNSIIYPTYPGYENMDIYNPEEAAALVQEAIAEGDWSADSKLIIGVVNTTGENAAILIKSQLAEIGIQVEIKQDEMATIQQAMITDLGEGSDYQYSAAIWTLGATYIPSKMLGVFALYSDSLFLHNETEEIYPIYEAYLTAQTAEADAAVIADFQAWEHENVPQCTVVQYGAYSATSPLVSNVDLFNTSNFNHASWLWTIND